MERLYFVLMRKQNVLGIDILQQNTSLFVHYAELHGQAGRQQTSPPPKSKSEIKDSL